MIIEGSVLSIENLVDLVVLHQHLSLPPPLQQIIYAVSFAVVVA